MSFPTQTATATYLEALESRTLLSVDVLVGAGVVHGTDGAFTLEDADSYEQHTRGTLQIEIGSATSFDQIHVGGEADLSGTLELQLENGFTPSLGQTFDVLSYGSRTNLEGFDRYDGLVIGNGLFFRPTYSGDKLTLTVTQESHLKPIVFIPGFGGSFPLDQSENGLKDWLRQRGPDPDSLGLEPLRRTYQGFVESLINVGYTPDVDLFVADWDWRTPVAVQDGTNDGALSNVTADSITDSVYESGVSYLGHQLNAAVDAWSALGNGPLGKVDVVTHSTGGLVSRSYIQSAAYGQTYAGGTKTLPTIDNLVQVGVPNQGVTATFNMLKNDFSLELGSRVLGRTLALAYEELLAGNDI